MAAVSLRKPTERFLCFTVDLFFSECNKDNTKFQILSEVSDGKPVRNGEFVKPECNFLSPFIW